MLYDLLCLIVLAVIANQTKKPIIAASAFGLIKAIAFFFLGLNSIEEVAPASLYIPSFIQFILAGFIGYGISVIVVRHPKDKELMVVTLVLSVVTFMTRAMSFGI